MVTNTATVAHDAYTLETTPVVYGLNCDQMVLKIDCATHPFFELPRVRTTRFKSSFINYAVGHYYNTFIRHSGRKRAKITVKYIQGHAANTSFAHSGKHQS